VPEERHDVAPGLLEKQEADPARSRDWFPRKAITSAPSRDVIGLATEEWRRSDWIVAEAATLLPDDLVILASRGGRH